MLQIKGIRKVYKTGNLVQEALKGVSLTLRDNEFVAILGQSGSGKTTLLNILGGLDRYNDGDLIINGVSTKRYTDRDWDSYRNHSVGFVFQSYNLIPHQTVLKNVELALTISGVSSSERTARATEALDKVGLSEHIHKKPSQLSGGQMQRVAIARALVNNPKVLLADEPTGALDSETSLQVMDLLKEVAEDRLVVMVTHNPDLAEQYATRIVNLKDGQITSDSDPCEPEDTNAVHKSMGRSSMSLLTSLMLSFNNLWTKKARTILVSFAGSIGIIGIALILAMSNGANTYIRSVEEESLQDYPLQITDSSMNLTSMYMTGMNTAREASSATADQAQIKEWSMVTGFLSGIKTNDLKSLRSYFESDECDIYDHVQTIEYDYNVVPRIYRETDKSYRQVNPNNSFAPLGFSGSEDTTSGLLSSFSNSDVFYVMPEKNELFQKNFELKAGKWPESYNECIVTLTSSGRISDLTLYTLGLKDPAELDSMINAFAEGKDTQAAVSTKSYSYDDIIGIEFKLLPTSSLYTYDKNYKVWSDRSSDEKFVKDKLKAAETLKIVGVAQMSEDASSGAANSIGIGYPHSLTDHVIETAAKSEIVQQQLKNPEVNVITGKKFDDENQKDSGMDMSKLFSVDEDAIKKAFNVDSLADSGFDLSSLDLSGLDFSNMDMDLDVSDLDVGDMSSMMPQLDEETIKELLNGININMTESTLSDLFTQMLSGYQKYSADDKRADISSLPSALLQYLNTEDAQNLIIDHFKKIIDERGKEVITEEDVAAIAQEYVEGYALWLAAHSFEPNDTSHIAEYVRSEEAAEILRNGVETLQDKLKKLEPTDEDINSLINDIVSEYEAYADKQSLPSASYVLKSFQNYLATDEAQSLITKTVSESVDASGLEQSISKYSDAISSQLSAVMQTILSSVGTQISSALENSMSSLMSGLSTDLLSGFDFNTDALADMFKTEMSAQEIKDLMTSLLSTSKSSLESNFKKLGYADIEKPSSITIYPNDFDSKNHVKQIISDYNDRMQAAGEEDKVIEYTDLVDALMGSVTTIIDAISYILIAFVAISLVVSSIMIGVITYISVLERRKEIGILRAIGASKGNISQVFNAETFIIGAFAGVIGIVISEIIILIANPILHSLTGQDIRAILPPLAIVILILLSIVLTLIGGIIPSRKAAKSDPVAALRSE